jgi:hypothetical protein
MLVLASSVAVGHPAALPEIRAAIGRAPLLTLAPASFDGPDPPAPAVIRRYRDVLVPEPLAEARRSWLALDEAPLVYVTFASVATGSRSEQVDLMVQLIASRGVAGSGVSAPRARRATPLVTAASATACATDSATRRLKTLGMM